MTRTPSQKSSRFSILQQEIAELQQQGSSQQAIIERYQDDPVSYFDLELGITPWTLQKALLDDVAIQTRVITRSGHKVSKSCSACGLALWWIETRRPATCLLTAPTHNQVKHVLWEELGARYGAVKHRIQGEFPKDPLTGLRHYNGNRIIGISSDQPERIGGISGPNMLVIVDEGSGYDDRLFEALEGNAAGGGKLIAFGNPTQTTGWFYEAFRGRKGSWSKHHISSEQSPNVLAGRVVIPGLATREYIEQMRADYGPAYSTDPTYMVRVAGEFAEHQTNAIVGAKSVELAQERHATAKPDGELRVGVDVARFGDDETVIQPVRGMYAYSPEVLRNLDGVAVAAHVLSVVQGLRGEDRCVQINVDGVGVGASVYDALVHSPMCKGKAIEVADVQAGARSTDGDHHNLRSQLWFGVSTWLKEGGAIPPEPRLEQELLAPVYTFDVQGRKKAESKDDIKKKLKRSPDRADALALAVYKAPIFRMRGLHIPGI